MGRVVEVAVDQHTSRQRVERSKEIISAAFEVDAQASQQPCQLLQLPSQQHSAGTGGAGVSSDPQIDEGQRQARTAALSLALTYS